LEPLCENWNNQEIENTKYKRKAVDKYNYTDMMSQKLGLKDASMLDNLAEGRIALPSVEKRLYKFSLGDKVLLARKVSYEITKKSHFDKATVVGNYGSKVYTIQDRMWKSNKDGMLVVMYKLSNLHGLYYQSELLPANNMIMD
jgi:hypothetical protein